MRRCDATMKGVQIGARLRIELGKRERGPTRREIAQPVVRFEGDGFKPTTTELEGASL
jgi:hypothetical protein